MNNFAVYMIGAVLVIAGLAYAASLMGIAVHWIIIGAIVIIGFAIMGAVKKTQRKEHS